MRTGYIHSMMCNKYYSDTYTSCTSKECAALNTTDPTDPRSEVTSIRRVRTLVKGQERFERILIITFADGTLKRTELDYDDAFIYVYVATLPAGTRDGYGAAEYAPVRRFTRRRNDSNA